MFAGPRVRVFGEVRVTGAGDVGSRRARTLLAVLALAGGRPVPIAQLTATVWGDVRPPAPLEELGVLVARLRRELGTDALRRESGGYVLHGARVDRLELSRGLDEAARRLAAGQPGAALAAARSALAVADGEMLAGETGTWADAERADAERDLARGARLVAEASLQVGDVPAAIAAALAAAADDVLTRARNADRREPGATTLTVRCDPIGRDLPLQPVLDGLAALLAERGRAGARACLGADAAQVAPLITGQVSPPGAAGLPGDAADVRRRLFDALLRVLGRAAGDGTPAIVVSDVVVADPATVEWLRLATSRGDRLVLATSPASPGRVADAAGTVRAAAVLDPVVDLDLLATVLERPPAEVLDDLVDGERGGLLSADGRGLRFAAEAHRELAAAAVPAARRTDLHRRAAVALDDRGGQCPLRVAWHARLGGEPGLAASALVTASGIAIGRGAVDVAAALARDALRLAPSADAHLALAAALLRTGDLVGADGAVRTAIDTGAGAAAYEVAGWVAFYRRDEARGLRLAQAGALRTDDPASQAGSAALAGRLLHAAGDLTRAERALDDALAGTAPSGAGTPRVFLAALRAHQGRPADALDLADSTLVVPGSVRQPEALGHGHFARWLSLGMLGRAGDLLTATGAFAAAPLPEPVHARFRPMTLTFRGWALRNLGAPASADEASYEAIARATGTGLAEPAAQAGLDLVETALIAGDPDGVRARLAAVALEPDDGGTMVWHQRERVSLLRAEAAYAVGAWDDAAALAEALAGSARARGSRRHATLARVIALLARAHTGPVPPADVAAGLAELETTAGLEAWRWTARAAVVLRVDAWRAAAETQVALLAKGAPAHADDVHRFASRWLDRVHA